MTAPTWADRSLPLAERVRLALLDPLLIGVSATAHRDELVEDIAAAERLARAESVREDLRGVRMEVTRRIDVGETTHLTFDASAQIQADTERRAALAAYRARRVQAVGDV
jgi:hypothetical protein